MYIYVCVRACVCVCVVGEKCMVLFRFMAYQLLLVI